MAHRKLMAALGVAAMLLGTTTACTPEPIVNIPSASQGPSAPALKIGTPVVPDGVNPQEGELLAHVYAAALKAAGVAATVVPTPVMPSQLVTSLESGSIDLLPVYSRLALAGVDPAAGAVVGSAADSVSALKAALPTGISQLDAAKAEDRSAVVVTAVTAEKYQLKSLSDIGQVCDKLVMSGTKAFMTKPNGLPGLGSDYNCVPKKYLPLQPTANYSADSILWALLRDDAQMISMHTSSPTIADNSLVVLDDPKQLFLSQNIVPLVATGKVPATAQSGVNKVSAALGMDELGNLNRLALDGHYDAVTDAADAWLLQQGLIKARS
ncbi:glycine betaine ABC transporter substrate-binding protein [Arthrobacter sp. E3]|uniref:glycine betaine ABC transporter substrate-binding protein n=1 Tax=Arthrobacter sp. E3 TaxID=517402 RepID=UPI001A94CB72